MNCKSFTIDSRGGFYDYPLPPEAPFQVRISLRGVSALSEIERISAAEPLVLPSQVHGVNVVRASRASLYPERTEADGLLIFPGDPVCGLRFADCAPVLILSLSKRPWLLALHSGFRGTLRNITAAGMSLARRECGDINPSEIFAWVGPCISGKCYDRRVDDPSTAAALKVFSPDAVCAAGEYANISLKRQIAHQLADEGIREDRIFLESQCTHCRDDLFYSHRSRTRDDDPRMLLTVRS